jgi:hypothetical protein
MGKDLSEYYNDDTREVLFEKQQVYYYKQGESEQFLGMIACLEQCLVINGETMIGSGACCDCKHNKGFNEDSGFIICSRLNEARFGKNG